MAETYVLVHGAWHGGWCWDRVASLLAADGSRVLTPTLTGLGTRAHLLTPEVGLDTFIADICSVIASLRDVVLVGHSFGGGVISGVADMLADRIARLVFVDALVIHSGQRPFDDVPPDAVAARRASAAAFGGLAMPAPAPEAFGVLDATDAAWLSANLTPQPIKPYEDRLRLRHPLGNGRPKTYIACTAPAYPFMLATHARIRRASGWTYREIATGHDAMISAPGLLADMLRDEGTSQQSC